MAKGDKNTGKQPDSAGDLLKGDASELAKDVAKDAHSEVADVEHEVTGEADALKGGAEHVEAEAQKGFGLLAQLGKQVESATSVQAHAALHAALGLLASLRAKLKDAEKHADGEVKDFIAALRKHL